MRRPPAEPGSSVSPTAGSDRIAALDTLRGVAILGILVMNVYGFAMPVAAYVNPLLAGGTEWYNLGTWFVTHVFFDQKFMTIFALLFGAGIVIMSQRSEARGVQFAPLFFRRQFWLLAIGAVHAYLIWWGDILMPYAIVGMLAFAFRKLPPGALLVVAVSMLLIAPLMSLGSTSYLSDLQERAEAIEARLGTGEPIDRQERAVLEEWEALAPSIAPDQESLQRDLDAYRGSYTEILAYRAPRVTKYQLAGLLSFSVWRIGGLMALGMALVKLGIITGRRGTEFYRRMLMLGYGIGLPLTLLSAWLSWRTHWDGVFLATAGSLPNSAGSVFVALGHLALVMLAVRACWLASLAQRLAAVGRMALSNYLVHSLVMTTVFYGYGAGLYGSVSRLGQMAFVVVLVAFQLWYSPLWLRHFRFGPAEWLWRSLTYRSLQPCRRRPAPV